MRRIILPLVEIKMVFPSGLNFRPVHSMSLSAEKGLIFFRENEIRKYYLVFSANVPWNLKDENGPLSNDLRS